MVLAVTAAITLAFGVILGVGGVWLSSLGGSAYYLIIGISLSAIGLSLWQRRAEALWFYAAVVAATLGWAIFEVGLDWWPLAARGGVIVLLGLWLLTPLVTRRLKWGTKEAVGRTRLVVIGPLAVALVASIATGVIAFLFVDLHGTKGVLPGQVAIIPASTIPDGDWPSYGRTLSGNRWSPLEAINTGNVGDLEVAWTYHTGEVPQAGSPATFEVGPLKVGDTLYICSPNQVAIALDAATGAERWRYDPVVDEAVLARRQTCQGVAYDGGRGSGACASRIYLPTADGRLLALDASTGTLCSDFGTGGTVDLWQSMPHRSDGAYLLTSPPVVAGGYVILGASVADPESGPLPSGVVRAYELSTGRLAWNFDAGNPDSITPRRPDQTFTDFAPNITAAMSVDEALGYVYVPTGNAPPVHYGAARTVQAENLSSAVLALDIRTGRMMWSFQTVHHDLWDMGVPAQPVLLDIMVRNIRIPVLVQATRQGDVYMLDRRTGQAVIPVTEEAAPQDGVADGDFVNPTQPASALSFAPRTLSEEDMWGLTMFDQLACRIWFQSLAYNGRFTPPSVQGTLLYPGNYGVFGWGGIAVDPLRQVMIGSPSYLAHRVRMIPRPELEPPPEPAAEAEEEPAEVAAGPEAETPATPEAEVAAVEEEPPAPPEDLRPLFTAEVDPFLSALGVPCNAPPWGYVAGVDLNSGRLAWQHAAGTVQDIAPVSLPVAMGVPTHGGPLATAGGLVFISGSLDDFIRAYDVTTGAELWSGRLPAGGQATPITYATADGRQFVVVAAGGNGTLGTTRGDEIVAYALPASATIAPGAASEAEPAAITPAEPLLPPTAAERPGANPTRVTPPDPAPPADEPPPAPADAGAATPEPPAPAP
ncbi:MAG: membrane-bound PQQ-dependent dehydrogenase, glucose/quinate/shikimate family [Bauldia sp.]|nr:membrane-bound PQQ-dependent dehydrogenase, glucose/quinate/shikimate family [Bauldia sp.]